MREKSIVPTSLLDWPRADGLLSDQRYIFLWLWSSPYITSAGAGHLPVRAAAATLGLSPDALADGLSTLQTAGLIDLDEQTGEVMIVDWFRWHSFKNGTQQRCLALDINRIRSERLKNAIREKSTTCVTTITTTITETENLNTSSGDEPQTPPKRESFKDKIKRQPQPQTCKDEDQDQNESQKPASTSPPAGAHPPARAAWDAYNSSMLARYGVGVPDTAQNRAIVKQFVAYAGGDAAGAIRHFVERMSDDWYVRNIHSLSVLSRDATKVLSNYRGKLPMTLREARHSVLHMTDTGRNPTEGLDSEGRPL